MELTLKHWKEHDNKKKNGFIDDLFPELNNVIVNDRKNLDATFRKK